MKLLCRFLIVLILIFVPELSLCWAGKVVGVSDGDTISVLKGHRTEKIRLFGIDCPESDQDFGTKARKFTAKMVFGKVVEVMPVGDVSYGRTVAWVNIDGQSLNKELVRNGLAWWYRRHAENETELELLEAEAREQRIGLWSHPHPVPPWTFRRDQRDEATF